MVAISGSTPDNWPHFCSDLHLVLSIRLVWKMSRDEMSESARQHFRCFRKRVEYWWKLLLQLRVKPDDRTTSDWTLHSQSSFLRHASISCCFFRSAPSLETRAAMQTEREPTRDLGSGIFVHNSAVNELSQPLVSAKVSQFKVVVETNL